MISKSNRTKTPKDRMTSIFKIVLDVSAFSYLCHRKFLCSVKASFNHEILLSRSTKLAYRFRFLSLLKVSVILDESGSPYRDRVSTPLKETSCVGVVDILSTTAADQIPTDGCSLAQVLLVVDFTGFDDFNCLFVVHDRFLFHRMISLAMVNGAMRKPSDIPNRNNRMPIKNAKTPNISLMMM
jgi:hypothetical protein